MALLNALQRANFLPSWQYVCGNGSYVIGRATFGSHCTATLRLASGYILETVLKLISAGTLAPLYFLANHYANGTYSIDAVLLVVMVVASNSAHCYLYEECSTGSK